MKGDNLVAAAVFVAALALFGSGVAVGENVRPVYKRVYCNDKSLIKALVSSDINLSDEQMGALLKNIEKARKK